MNEIFRKESELFEFLKKSHIHDLQTCEDNYSFYDCYSAEKQLDIELKCRHTHYDELLIEKMKYDHLLERALEFRTRPLYINSTPFGVYVFDLTKIPAPNWEERKMPSTTYFSNREKIIKVVGYLHIKDAKQLL